MSVSSFTQRSLISFMPQMLWHKGSGAVTQQAGSEQCVQAPHSRGLATPPRAEIDVPFCLLGAYGLLEMIDSLISHTNNCEITLVGSAVREGTRCL